MAPSTTSILTIQPWTPDSATSNDLRDVLSRAQRGHLRDITEASLQEEVATEGALESSDESSDDGGEAGEDADNVDAKNAPIFGKPSARDDLFKARNYMLAAVGAARQEVGISLDLMSLLVSKDRPDQARVTLGKQVAEKVPLGTISVDFWQRMPVDATREAQDSLLAANVKMDSLQNAADGLLGAAKRMEDNVRRETQYWEQILSISSKGWNVCRVPGQQHKLGVRFGFSESVPQFSRKGIAALNPDREGGIRLERGVGSRPKALRTVLRKQQKVVGASRLPSVQDADKTTLEARIRHARDSLFDEELYHEIIRESRTLTSLGVHMEGSTIQVQPVSPDAQAEGIGVSFDLVSLDEDNDLLDAGHGDDSLAQASIITARLLLSQAHRDRLRKRSQPPPPLSEKQKDDKPVLPILRPIMSLILHRSALDQLSDYLSTISRVLEAAHVEHSLQQPKLPSSNTINPSKNDTTAAESLITTTLLRPLISTATLNIPSPLNPQTLNLTLSTSLAPPSSGPLYNLHLPTSQQPYHTTDFTTFTSAASWLLSSALATTILPLVQNETQEWRVRGDEAVLEQDVGVGEVEQSFAIEIDERGRELKVVFTGRERKTFSWKAPKKGNDGTEQGLVDAVRGCLI